MIYFHSFRNPGLIIDIVSDIRALNELSRRSRKAGMIILGGGVCKHQIANAMLIVSSSGRISRLVSHYYYSAQWGGLFSVHCTSAPSLGVQSLKSSISTEYRTRVRWIGFRSASRRSGFVGQNPSRIGFSEGCSYSNILQLQLFTDICFSGLRRRYLSLSIACSGYVRPRYAQLNDETGR